MNSFFRNVLSSVRSLDSLAYTVMMTMRSGFKGIFRGSEKQLCFSLGILLVYFKLKKKEEGRKREKKK